MENQESKSAGTEGIAGLPPAGDGRREEMKKRFDKLEEQGEIKFKDVGKIDPEKMKPDNEILGLINKVPNLLGISNPQEGRKYKWVYVGINGYFITQARFQGWVPVQGDDKEAIERIWTDTTRKLGDTILMWIEEGKYKELEQADFQKRMLQQRSITAELEEAGEKTGVRVSRGFRNADMLRRLQEQSFARQMAEKRFKQMIQDGRIPGMEIE